MSPKITGKCHYGVQTKAVLYIFQDNLFLSAKLAMGVDTKLGSTVATTPHRQPSEPRSNRVKTAFFCLLFCASKKVRIRSSKKQKAASTQHGARFSQTIYDN